MAVNSPPSCSLRIVVSMRQRCLQCWEVSLSTSSLECSVLCMVISFLVLWSICLSSISGPLPKGSRISNVGHGPGIYSFDKVSPSGFCRVVFWFCNILIKFCLYFPLVWWRQPPRCKSICRFRFLSVLILSWFVSSIPSVRCSLPLFIISMAHFSMLNSIPISWLDILIVCIRVSSSFSFFFLYHLESFSNQRLLIFFHWRLSDSKSPPVSWQDKQDMLGTAGEIRTDPYVIFIYELQNLDTLAEQKRFTCISSLQTLDAI